MDKRSSRNSKGLNAQQYLFVINYIKGKCQNITQAALAAGYSEKSANLAGRKILKKQAAQDVVEALFHKIVVQKYEKSAEEVLNEIAGIAFCDMADYFNIDREGQPILKTLDEMGSKSKFIKKIKHKRTTRVINEIEFVDDHYEYEMYDKLGALEILAKFHKVIQGGTPTEENPKNKVEALPRIYLPDNGHGGKAVIAVEWKNK